MREKILINKIINHSLVVIILFNLLSCSDDNDWNKNAAVSSVAIENSNNELFGSGKDGFTEIYSTYSGVNTSNDIGEKEILKNQHLMHGSGVAIGDVNNDGLVDIYIPRIKEDNVLYINKGEWQFEDFTSIAGVEASNRYSTGSVFADVDGDRDLDLIVTALGGPNSLFINNGSGIFSEKILESNLKNPGSTSTSLADVDNDGDLDLYITNYKRIAMRDSLPPPALSFDNTLIELENGDWEVIPPFNREYEAEVKGDKLFRFEFGEVDQFYFNDGKGNFKLIDITKNNFFDQKGNPINEHLKDWGLVAQFRDINNDNHPDIYICNDFESPDRIWINNGDGSFNEIEKTAIRHTSNSSMSVDFSDLNKDGYVDLFVSDMLSQSHIMKKTQMGTMIPTTLLIGEIENRPQYMRNTLFVNRKDHTFSEIGQYSNTYASEWSWASAFMDVDLDGNEDVLITTGHVYDVQDSDSIEKQKKALSSVRSFDEYKRMLLKFPRLSLKNVAFRNKGNLQFETIENGWGIGNDKDISHGMAYGDLDNDVDLDVVINRLNQNVGLFRNDTNAPRIAIRLEGKSPNTDAIGAKIYISGGPTPQSREIISGGRYLSGSDQLQVFAASNDKLMTAEINWRDGSRTLVDSLKANKLYKIRQINTIAGKKNEPMKEPLFENVSNLLNHEHHENPFDDFANQSLLPNGFSQTGPGVLWMDIDNDNDQDIFIGSGAGGSLDYFRNDGGLSFTPFSVTSNIKKDITAMLSTSSDNGSIGLIAAFSNMEEEKIKSSEIKSFLRSGEKKFNSINGMIGPMSQADIDGDGDLDLFVGGRWKPNEYPKPASSIIYLNENGNYIVDKKNLNVLNGIGMVTSSLFSDIDNDNDQDLIIALEWGPITILENVNSTFKNSTSKLGLSNYKGWWNGVSTGDFNNDGRPDIVATNWGLNTKYHFSIDHPRKVYFNDFDNNNVLDIVEAHYDNDFDGLVPERGFSCMSNAMPFIREEKETFLNYAQSSLFDIFGNELNSAPSLEANTLESMVFINTGSGFNSTPLPFEAQITTGMHVGVSDVNGDGNEDIFISQNFFAVQRETDRNDSGRGLIILGDGKGNFKSLPGQESGILVYGEQRGAAFADYNNDQRVDLAITQNGAKTMMYKNKLSKPGISIELNGPKENPMAFGSSIQIEYLNGDRGPKREIRSGAGYLSQDSPVQILGLKENPKFIHTIWPDGKMKKQKITKMQIALNYDD